jgi:hypothetical protein
MSEMNTYRLKSIASVLAGMHRVMTADELAKLLQMSRITILRRARRGLIPILDLSQRLRRPRISFPPPLSWEKFRPLSSAASALRSFRSMAGPTGKWMKDSGESWTFRQASSSGASV